MTVHMRASLDRIKQIVAAIGVLVAVVIPMALVAAATIIIVAATTGADPRTAFTDPNPVPADIGELLIWQADDLPLLRSVEPSTRTAVATAWVRGLESVDAVVEGDDRALTTWFSGPALQQLESTSVMPAAIEGPAWNRHELQTWFYSLDGQIMGLRVTSQGDLDMGQPVEIVDEFDVIVVLRDGNWRIEHLVTANSAS